MQLNDLLIEGSFLVCLVALLIVKLAEYIRFRKRIKAVDLKVDHIGQRSRRKLIAEFERLRNEYSDMSLLVFADKYEWPKEIVTCLPKLYFDITPSKGQILIWKEVLDMAPVHKHSIKILKSYCKNEILSVRINYEAQEIIAKIALRIEHVRIQSPYNNYFSFLGAVNQVVNDLELETQALNKATLSYEFSKKRSQFLKDELDIHLGADQFSKTSE